MPEEVAARAGISGSGPPPAGFPAFAALSRVSVAMGEDYRDWSAGVPWRGRRGGRFENFRPISLKVGPVLKAGFQSCPPGGSAAFARRGLLNSPDGLQFRVWKSCGRAVGL